MEERIKSLKEKGDSKHIYQNELDKVCFQHDVAYRDFNDLPRRTEEQPLIKITW